MYIISFIYYVNGDISLFCPYFILGLKGKCVLISHIFNDCLCNTIPHARNLFPNLGFSPTRISALPTYDDPYSNSSSNDSSRSSSSSSSSSSAVDDAQQNITATEAMTGDVGAVGTGDSMIESSEQYDAEHEHKQSEANDNLDSSNQDLPPSSPPTTTLTPTLTPTPTERMDLLLKTAFFRCLKYIIKDFTLPLPISTVWSIILRCIIPEDNNEILTGISTENSGIKTDLKIDLKSSSYKKVSEFLSTYMDDYQLIRIINNEHNVQMLIYIARQHDLWRSISLNIKDPDAFRAYVRGEVDTYCNPTATPTTAPTTTPVPVATTYNVLETIQQSQQQHSNNNTIHSSSNNSNSVTGSIGGAGATYKVNKNNKYQIIELYKAPKKFIEEIFPSLLGEFGPYLRLHEVC